jgi:hypothetical protein
MNNLALTYSELGQHDQALQLELQALEMQHRVLPKDHPSIALSMYNLSTTRAHLGEFEEALQLAQQSLDIRKTSLPPNHPDIRQSLKQITNIRSAFQKICANPHCDKPNPQQTCPRCNTAKYCSQQCQQSSHRHHMKYCPGSKVLIKGLVKRSDLNNTIAVCHSVDAKTGSYTIRVPSPDGADADTQLMPINPGNTIVVGSKVVIVKKSRPDRHDQQGVVESFSDAGRVRVKIAQPLRLLDLLPKQLK